MRFFISAVFVLMSSIGGIAIASEETDFALETAQGEQTTIETVATKSYIFLAYSTPT